MVSLRLSIGPALIDQMLSSGTNFLFMVIIVRIFGLEVAGHFALLTTATSICFFVSRALISSPGAIFSATFRTASYRNFLQIFSLALGAVLAAVVGAGAKIFQIFGADISWVAVWIYVQGMLVHQTGRYIRSNMISVGYSARISAIASLLILGAFIPNIFLEEKLGLVLALAGIALIAISAAELFTNRGSDITCWRFHLSQHVRSGKWLLLGGSLSIAYEGGYVFLLGILSGPEAVALMKIPQQVYGLSGLVIQSLELFLPRSFASLSQFKPERFWGFVVRSLLSLTACASLVAFAMLLAMEKIVHFVFGSSTTPSVEVSAILATLVPLYALKSGLLSVLRARNKESKMFRATSVALTLSLFAMYPLVYLFGLLGMVAGLLGAELVTVGLLSFYVIRLARGDGRDIRARAHNG